jgi:hypothetical protein
VSQSTGVTPSRRAALATWFGSVVRPAHRSRLEAAAVCVSTPFGEPLGQRRAVDSPCGSSTVATRDASDQFLPSHVFVRAPVPRRFPSGRTLARSPSEIPSASRQNESLRWVPRGPSSGFHRVGRCIPVAMRENRTSDTPVASCPEPVELALLTLSNRPPRPPQSARVNDANQKTIQGAFHRSRTFAPQRPLGRPAPDFTRPAAWPPRFPLPTPLHPRGSFRDPSRAGPPSTSSRCQQGLRFSRPRSSLADFCNRYDVRAHPSSCRSSHASGAFAPLLAGTNRCRLRWPLRCVATPWACEPQSAHAGFHSDVLRLRGRDESRVEAFEQRRGSRALVTMSRVPFS